MIWYFDYNPCLPKLSNNALWIGKRPRLQSCSESNWHFPILISYEAPLRSTHFPLNGRLTLNQTKVEIQNKTDNHFRFILFKPYCEAPWTSDALALKNLFCCDYQIVGAWSVPSGVNACSTYTQDYDLGTWIKNFSLGFKTKWDYF